MPNYLSDMRPEFTPRTIDCGKIRCFKFKGDLKSELAAGKLTRQQAIDLLEDMLTVREFEQMIIKLRSGAYDCISDFEYRGPTHVSIGQEAASVGSIAGTAADDYVTSTHRGHGDSVAKGCAALRGMSTANLRKRLPTSKATTRKQLIDEALQDHIFRTIAELFGKEAGYCKGRGGGMHIADFTIGHLGANAIVGGGVPIATGAAQAARYLREDKVVCCFAGDGAYANGVVLESLNWAAMDQFTGTLAKNHKFGLPVIYVIQNNHYGMTHRTDNEVTGVDVLARRAAGFADNNMHAEVVNGMDVLATRDAINRAAALCRRGKGPVLIELDTYRFYGHSLSDPRNEYRTRDEEAAWREVDPIDTFTAALIKNKVMTQRKVDGLIARVEKRNAIAAKKAAHAADPDAADVLKYMYTDTNSEEVPAAFSEVEIINPLPEIKRTDGELTYRDAIKEAMVEEMKRDRRVMFYGEDVADYGGAFKATKGLLESFGRERVFNTPISEACICGTAVGAGMLGVRAIAELMYMDFALMASDQISNQAAKWHYMSGANAKIPVVYRASVGGGKGYGGQHSQTLETMFAHTPGLLVAYPSTPYDAKGMLKTAIRDDNPVMFVESQVLYGIKGEVPEAEYTIPFGVANIKRAGSDVTIVSWGPAALDAVTAAEQLEADGISAEVIDIRTLVPLDMDTILASVRKTGRCVVASQCISIGSFTGEIASRIMSEAFDYLDAPVVRVGAKDGIAPQSHVLEKAFLPDAADIEAAARSIV